MRHLAGGARKKDIVKKYGEINNWDVSNVTDMSIMFSSEEATFFKLASGVGTPRLARVAALMIRITSRSRVFCHLRSAELVGFAGPGHLSGKCQAPRKAGNGATAPTCLWTLSEKSTGVPVAGGFRIVDSPSAPGRAMSLACKGSDDGRRPCRARTA